MSAPVVATLSADERAVLAILSAARGASKAIGIEEIESKTGLNYRAVTSTIERLRTVHKRMIGSSRGTPHGYFIIESAQDLGQTIKPLKNQAIAMLHVVASLQGPRKSRLHELLGQLQIELDAEPEANHLHLARVAGTDDVIPSPPSSVTCWHCRRLPEGPGLCRCAFCAQRVGGLAWGEGRCIACAGTGRLVYPGRAGQRAMEDRAIDLPALIYKKSQFAVKSLI